MWLFFLNSWKLGKTGKKNPLTFTVFFHCKIFLLIRKTELWKTNKPPAVRNIINLRLDITHLYYPAKNSFQKSRLKRREIFTELLLYTLTT